MTPDFAVALKTSVVPEVGANVPTFTRASTAMVRDYQGVYQTVANGEARFQGARRVAENDWRDTDDAGLALHPSRITDDIRVFDHYRTAKVSTAYDIGDAVTPENAGGTAGGNGYWYQCMVAGTSGGIAPTWPTTIGVTVADGTVTWQNMGHYKLGGFLTEEERVNENLWNMDFNQWTQSAQAQVSSAIGIDGVSRSINLTDTSGTLAQQRRISMPKNIDTQQYTVSIFVKAQAGAPTIYPVFNVFFSGGPSSYGTSILLNTQTGVGIPVTILGGQNHDSLSITREGDWWRISIQLTDPDGHNSDTIFVAAFPAWNSDGSTTEDITATGATAFDFAQMEVGPSASSPIPTTNVAATRIADSLIYTKATADFDAEASVLVDTVHQGISAQSVITRLFAFSNNGLLSVDARATALSDGTTFYQGGLPSVPINIAARRAANWSGVLMNTHQDGVSTSGAVFDGSMDAVTTIHIGRNISGNTPLLGLVSNARGYFTDQGDARLAELTAYDNAGKLVVRNLDVEAMFLGSGQVERMYQGPNLFKQF